MIKRTKLENFTYEQIKFALENSKNYSDMLRNLQTYSDGPNYRRLKKILIKFNLKPSWKEDRLIKLQESVKVSCNMTEFLTNFGLSKSPLNYKRYKEEISTLGIDISHWIIKKYSERNNCVPRTKKPITFYLIKGSKIQSLSLKKRLIKEKLLKEECDWKDCPTRKMKNWRNKPIAYEIDHINGINNDNRLENLRILCRMCHAHTPTFSRKKSSLEKQK